MGDPFEWRPFSFVHAPIIWLFRQGIRTFAPLLPNARISRIMNVCVQHGNTEATQATVRTFGDPDTGRIRDRGSASTRNLKHLQPAIEDKHADQHLARLFALPL